VRTASLPPPGGTVREAELPTVLTVEDVQRYLWIFHVQETANWAAADYEIGLLKDRLLLGQVLAQRYEHKSYKASYRELTDWLKSYGDQGDVRAIHALAVQRREGAPAPAKPSTAPPAARGGGDDDAESLLQSSEELDRAYQLRDEIRRVAQGNPTKAEAMLDGLEAKHLLDDADIDDVRAAVADAYLAAGEPKRAYAITSMRKNSARPAAEWTAGLTEWRAKHYVEAGQHFQVAAKSPDATPGLVSAAAYWAARSELRNRHPELVNYWLGVSAQESYTFYGLLARRTLGVDTFFDFDMGAFTDLDARALMANPAGRRVLALLQIGDSKRAEGEMRAAATRGNGDMIQPLEALAGRANLPALSFWIAAFQSQSDGRNHDRALFPVPRWAPQGGFTVDRALLFALMRQESQFLSQARSRAGAFGVMQIMPATARSMAARVGMPPPDQGNLGDPETSLTLAQEYINRLQASDKIGKSLILLAASYNSGPAPVQRWLASDELKSDPLLFIESVPFRETRGFIERVLANYWIYRMRLGQPTPDLDALAAGSWPTYTAFDPPGGQGGSYASN